MARGCVIEYLHRIRGIGSSSDFACSPQSRIPSDLGGVDRKPRGRSRPGLNRAGLGVSFVLEFDSDASAALFGSRTSCGLALIERLCRKIEEKHRLLRGGWYYVYELCYHFAPG